MTVIAAAAPPTRPVAARRSPHSAAVLLGLLAAGLGAAFSWVPSIWYDEAATVVSATRSWSALWQEVHQVDAVHALYYAGMHVWFDLVGYSPFTLRLPSAIAGGIGVALAVELVDSIATRRLALLTGVVLLLIPRYTWAMTEGRSYALSSTLAILATLVLATALRADRRRSIVPWAAYAVSCAVAITLFAYLALLVVAHAVSVLLLARRGRIGARSGWAFAAAVGLVVLATAPVILEIAGQSGQVSWIEPPSWQTVESVFVNEYSALDPIFAAAAWSLAIGGVVVAVRASRRRGAVPSVRDALALVVPVLLIPAALLIGASFASPLYSPRYLTFTTFAFAFAIALGIDALVIRGRRPAVATVALLAVLSAPSYVGQRTPEAKQESSWAAVAALVGSYAPEERGETAVVYDRVAGHPTATARVMADAYPASFAALRDVGVVTPYAVASTLWGEQVPVQPSMLTGMDASWLIASDRSDASAATEAIESAGLTPTRRWHFSRVDVTYFTR